MLAEIEKIGERLSDLKQIILTHAHKSHVGGVAALKKASGTAVSSHAWEMDIIAGRRKAISSASTMANRSPAMPPRA